MQSGSGSGSDWRDGRRRVDARAKSKEQRASRARRRAKVTKGKRNAKNNVDKEKQIWGQQIQSPRTGENIENITYPCAQTLQEE